MLCVVVGHPVCNECAWHARIDTDEFLLFFLVWRILQLGDKNIPDKNCEHQRLIFDNCTAASRTFTSHQLDIPVICKLLFSCCFLKVNELFRTWNKYCVCLRVLIIYITQSNIQIPGLDGTCVNTRMYTDSLLYWHIRRHTRTCAHIHTHTRTHTHTNTHTHTYTNTHTYTHIHMHAHPHAHRFIDTSASTPQLSLETQNFWHANVFLWTPIVFHDCLVYKWRRNFWIVEIHKKLLN